MNLFFNKNIDLSKNNKVCIEKTKIIYHYYAFSLYILFDFLNLLHL